MYKIHYEKSNTDICTPQKIYSDPIYVVEIGHSTPKAGYRSNHLNRKFYVLHIVLSGKGSFMDVPIEGPAVFLMKPDTVQYYTVSDDPDNPAWEQYWIMFGGDETGRFLKNAGFAADRQIYQGSYVYRAAQILRDLQLQVNYLNCDDHYAMLTGLFHILSLHSAGNSKMPQEKKYSQGIRQICDFIHANYASHLCEADLANTVHLSTHYMHRIFKNETGISPMYYLNSYRISCAKKLLVSHKSLTVQQIAEAVGFSDPNYFCCVFKRHSCGVSPTQYKKTVQSDTCKVQKA